MIGNNGRNLGPELLIFDANGGGLDIDWISIRGAPREIDSRESKCENRTAKTWEVALARWNRSSPVWLSAASH